MGGSDEEEGDVGVNVEVEGKRVSLFEVIGSSGRRKSKDVSLSRSDKEMGVVWRKGRERCLFGCGLRGTPRKEKV